MKIYILFFISLSIILTVAVIAAFRYGLVLAASRLPWLPATLAIALLLFAVFCGVQYVFGRVAPRQRRLFLSLAVGNGALGLSELAVVLCGPRTSPIMKSILLGVVIFSVVLFQGLVLFSALAEEDKISQ